MALRTLASQGRARAAGAAAPRRAAGAALATAAASAPSVLDVAVDLTVIDGAGRRHALRGVAGQPLVDLLAAHLDALGEGAVAASPEGRGAAEAHVKLPNELLAAYPRSADDEELLRAVAEEGEVDGHSLCASLIALGPALAGATVALAPNRPWRTL